MLKKFFINKFQKKILEIYPMTLVLSAITSFMGIKFLDNYEKNSFITLTVALYISIPLCAKFEGALHYKNKKFKIFYGLLLANFISVFMYFDKITGKEKGLSIGLLAIFYILFFLFTPSKDFKDENTNLRYFIRNISTLLNSMISSLILYLGLIFIVFSLKELFNINFGHKIYGNLYIFIMGFFFVPIFLSGIEEDNSNIYSKFFEFLLSKVIFPLVIIYLFILYAYLGKIILTRTYPKNIVPYLTLVYSFGGVFFYYLSKNMNNKYINMYLEKFFLLLIPIISMSYFSIIPRIVQYSITENRYFILLATLWFSMLIIVNIFFKNKTIIFLRNSLLTLSFISAIGPLSAPRLSRQFQLSRLEKLLNIPKENLNNENLKEIYEILYYFKYKHNITNTKLTEKDLNPEELMKELGYSYEPFNNSSIYNWYNFEGSVKAYNIKDFDYYIPRLDKALNFNNINIEMNKSNTLLIKKGEIVEELEIKTIIKEFQTKYGNKAKNERNQIVEELIYNWSIPEFGIELMIIFKDLNFSINKEGEFENIYYELSLLIKDLS